MSDIVKKALATAKDIDSGLIWKMLLGTNGEWLADDLRELIAEIERLRAAQSEIKLLVDKQAMDSSLWFVAQYASEAYLQQELRRLHGLIEARAAHYCLSRTQRINP